MTMITRSRQHEEETQPSSTTTKTNNNNDRNRQRSRQRGRRRRPHSPPQTPSENQENVAPSRQSKTKHARTGSPKHNKKNLKKPAAIATSTTPVSVVTKKDVVTEEDPKKIQDPQQQQVVALDCEMVGVGPGGKRSVLARVSVICMDGTTLLDSFVHVAERVTDYRTHVSGVRCGDLTGPNAADFGVVRRRVLDLLRNKILVGHALSNDLQIMKIHHAWYMIRDTSLYEPFMRYNYHANMMVPQKLRTLTQLYLNRTIQHDATSGHDSCIDARAALDLYKLVQKEWEEAVEFAKMQYYSATTAIAAYSSPHHAVAAAHHYVSTKSYECGGGGYGSNSHHAPPQYNNHHHNSNNNNFGGY